MSDPKKPSSAEEEYFAREQIKRKEQAKIRQSHEEREKLKQLHWMRCPKCGSELTEVLFRDVSIDRCRGCNGVYLDDGELEKLAGQEGDIVRSVVEFFKKG